MFIKNIDNFIFDNFKSVNKSPNDNNILFNFLKYLIIYRVKFGNSYYKYIIKELINKNLEELKENNFLVDEFEEDFENKNISILNIITNISKYDEVISNILSKDILEKLNKIIDITDDNIKIKNEKFFNNLIEDIRNVKNLDIIKLKQNLYPELEKKDLIKNLEKKYKFNVNNEYEFDFLNMNLLKGK